jgi:hypothetical protein
MKEAWLWGMWQLETGFSSRIQLGVELIIPTDAGELEHVKLHCGSGLPSLFIPLFTWLFL